MALSSAANQAIWLRSLLVDLGHKQNYATLIYRDKKSTIAIAYNPVQHSRT